MRYEGDTLEGNNPPLLESSAVLVLSEIPFLGGRPMKSPIAIVTPSAKEKHGRMQDTHPLVLPPCISPPVLSRIVSIGRDLAAGSKCLHEFSVPRISAIGSKKNMRNVDMRKQNTGI